MDVGGSVDLHSMIPVVQGVYAVRLPADWASYDEPLLRNYSVQVKQEWLRLRVVPFKLLRNTVEVVTSHTVTPEWAGIVRSWFPNRKVLLSYVTEEQVVGRLLELYGSEFSVAAANTVFDRDPAASARSTFSGGQKLFGLFLVLGIAGLVWWNWAVTLVVAGLVLSGLFLVSIIFKFYFSLQGAKLDNVIQVKEKQIEELVDEELPVYTILVPVYKEANIVGKLVTNLGGLDWPVEKLEVLVLTEEDDQETRDAVAAANPPEYMSVITVPDSVPRTKPKACNYGLMVAAGDYVTVYDAEDQPDSDQLKKTYITFRDGPDDLVCVQAALNYFNAKENILTRMFTLEYSFWFDYMLPGLERQEQPIPLGGTSNHFVTDKLRHLGGWDAWNVTEDADLGIRAAAEGWRVGVVNSTTLEEANTSVPNFVRQRSRWIKGYLQTSVVHTRNPWLMISRSGLKQFLSFLLLVMGTPLTFLAVIPLYAISLWFLLFGVHEDVSVLLPSWMLVLTLGNFILGNGLMVYVSMMGAIRRRKFWLIGWALLNPVYWLLHSVASYKALWQLLVKPHYWEKTSHGLTKQSAEDAEPEFMVHPLITGVLRLPEEVAG